MSLKTGDQVERLWEEIKSRIKEQGFNLPLYRALDSAVPIALDGAVLAIGYDAESYGQASLLEVPQHRNLIQRTLQTFSESLELFIVEGTGVQDYHTALDRQQAASATLKDMLQTRRERQTTEEILQGVSQRFHQRYQSLAGRGLPQIKARFLLECLDELLEAEQRMSGQEGEDDQAREKQFARVIDRLAGMTDLPPALVALEYLRHRETRGGQ